MREIFKALIQPFSEKLENLFKIGSYTRVKGSDGELQKIQIKTLRNIEDALKVGNFGLNSKAPLKSRAVVAEIGNEKIVIANEHIASIIDVASGDTVVYNEAGTFIKLEGSSISISGATISIDGNLQVTGNIQSDGNIEGASVKDTTLDTTLGTHTHFDSVPAPTTAPTPGT